MKARQFADAATNGPACEAWGALRSLMEAERGRLGAASAAHGLAPTQALALCSLSPERPIAMGELALLLACDSSNVTGIADRLERRGLVRRAPSPTDRRLKMLVVTTSGARIRRALVAALAEPPEALRALPEADQCTLRDILSRALGAD